MPTEIIARDTIAVTNFEYRIARVEREGANQQIQVRFVRKDGTFGDWESANMGHYQSRASALDNFLPRYGTIGADFTPLDPGLKEKFAKRNREATLIEQGRLKAQAQAKIDRTHEEERRNLIRAEFQKAIFRNESVDLRGQTGVIDTQRVPTIGGLAVTVAGTRNRKKVYGLTHQGTGLAVGPDDFETQGAAKLAAFRLTQITDFTQDQKALAATGIPFGSIANSLRRDSLADISDRLPARSAPILESQPIARPEVVSARQKIKELKDSQAKRRVEILSKTPTGAELLATAPANLRDKFLFPSGSAMARTSLESNRLVEATLNAAKAADRNALTETHPNIDVLDQLFRTMNDEERKSFLNLLPSGDVPFWKKDQRRSATPKPKVMKARVLPTPQPLGTGTAFTAKVPQFPGETLGGKREITSVSFAPSGTTFAVKSEGSPFKTIRMSEKDVRAEIALGQGKPVLPARTADTMSEAIAMSSPSGRQSKRSKRAAEERLRVSLFGPGGLQRSGVAQPSKADALRRRSKELRELAGRGMSPRKFTKEADVLDATAARLERPTVRPQLGISDRAATARFNNPRAGVGKGNKKRNPVADARITASVVAPARATNAKDVKLQQRWFKHPGRLDFQGVDTGPRKAFRRSRTP